MNPAEVPAELVEKAMREYLPGLYDTREEVMRHALAAVLPEIQAQAWNAGFNAATGAVPGDVWFDAWDTIDNPHRAARLTAEEPTT